MRVLFVWLAAQLLLGCDSTSESATPAAPKTTDPVAAPVQAPPGVKKRPLATRPLPPLEAEESAKPAKGHTATSTATGKPLRSLGFGGLGIDTPTDMAIAANGDIY